MLTFIHFRPRDHKDNNSRHSRRLPTRKGIATSCKSSEPDDWQKLGLSFLKRDAEQQKLRAMRNEEEHKLRAIKSILVPKDVASLFERASRRVHPSRSPRLSRRTRLEKTGGSPAT